MNNYEDWAQLVAKKLKGEADLIAAIEKDELDDAAATDAFVRAVLEPFLPENYGVGSGRIVDAFGSYSEHLDVIVYNRDFPRIGMRGTHAVYLYESVLATFSVKAKFIRKTFFESLNACASLADLETNMDKTVLVRLAKKNGLKPGPNKKFIHDDPIRTARFDLIGRPPAFVFGFTGIKHSYRQLQENIELWLGNRQQDGLDTQMKSIPAVIATQGCFAWRNAAPLALSNREMLGIGNDDAPIRLIVLQMLYLLNRRLHVTADGYGLKPNLNAYLSQFAAPKFEVGVGNVGEAATPPKASRDTMRFESARDHHAAAELAAASASVAPEPAAKKAVPVSAAPEPPAKEVAAVSLVPEPPAKEAAPVSLAPEPAAKETAPVSKIEEPPQEVVFDKPSPFASAPTPSFEAPATEDAAPQLSEQAAEFDKPSPFTSAPVPPVEEPEPPRPRAPAAPLGSTPIPAMSETPATEPEPAAAPKAAPLSSAPTPPKEPVGDVIPPKPPVDFDLGADNAPLEDKPDPVVDEFENTVVIPPNAGASSNETARNSTDAFIARVKEQLSTSETAVENKQDPFSSTVPQ